MPKIILLSANAYSGSTLFSLFIGSHPNIINLGEVINLENDYAPNVHCTCGNFLVDCNYWQKIKAALESPKSSLVNFELSSRGKRSLIDRKGISFRKLLVVLGIKPNYVYGKKRINEYIQKNVNFFKEIDNLNEKGKYIIDASKPSERIDILIKSSDLDIYCIHLKRNLAAILESNLKRNKKTRNKFRFKFYRELLLLFLRETHRRRVFKKIPSEKKIMVDFDNFKKNPDYEFKKILKLLSLDETMEYTVNRNIDITKQHIYVGNRWIFEKNLKNITLLNSVNNFTQKSFIRRKLIAFFLKDIK